MAGDHCLNLTLIDLEDEDYPFLELGSNVVKVGGAAEKYFLTSRLCGTRCQHLLLVGGITVEPRYLVIIDLVATLDTDELVTLLTIVDSIRMVEVVDPTP